MDASDHATTVAAGTRTRHLALRTETTYLKWMRRHVKFHRRHLRDMGPAEVEAFLTHLAVAGKVSASTQNQALQALLFLYRQVPRTCSMAAVCG